MVRKQVLRGAIVAPPPPSARILLQRTDGHGYTQTDRQTCISRVPAAPKKAFKPKTVNTRTLVLIYLDVCPAVVVVQEIPRGLLSNITSLYSVSRSVNV